MKTASQILCAAALLPAAVFFAGCDLIEDIATPEPGWADVCHYEQVTELNASFATTATQGIHEFILDVDTNDPAVSPAALTYQLSHDGVSPLTLSSAYEQSRNWDLSSNGDNDNNGVHIYITNHLNGEGHVVIRLRLVANPDAIIKGTFATAWTWTFAISGFSPAHDLDVTTTANNTSGTAISPDP